MGEERVRGGTNEEEVELGEIGEKEKIIKEEKEECQGQESCLPTVQYDSA